MGSGECGDEREKLDGRRQCLGSTNETNVGMSGAGNGRMETGIWLKAKLTL